MPPKAGRANSSREVGQRSLKGPTTFTVCRSAFLRRPLADEDLWTGPAVVVVVMRVAFHRPGRFVKVFVNYIRRAARDSSGRDYLEVRVDGLDRRKQRDLREPESTGTAGRDDEPGGLSGRYRMSRQQNSALRPVRSNLGHLAAGIHGRPIAALDVKCQRSGETGSCPRQRP